MKKSWCQQKPINVIKQKKPPNTQWLLWNAAFFPVQPAYNEDKLQRKMI
jgi:hypothetical protein